MLKIAIIDTHPIQYNSPLYKLLAKEDGFKVKVFYTWEQDAQKFDIDFGKEIEWDINLTEGFDFTFVSNDGIKERSFFKVKNPNLEKEILLWGATHVIINGWSYWSHLRSMFSLKGKVKIIFKGDSHLLNEKFGIKRLIRRIFLTVIYKFVDCCLFMGENNRNYFLTHGINMSQLFFSPHAIDNDRFRSAIGNRDLLRDHLKIGPYDRLICYTGKFISRKNLLSLVKAFNAINGERLHLLFVGDGNLEVEIKSEANSNKKIHFLPFQNQSEIPLIYKASDLFILPSTIETWGLSVNEAMACGLPILVSENCGCEKDLLKDGENGFLIKDSNIYDCLLKVSKLSDRELKNMGERSKAIVANYSYMNAIQGIKAAVKSTLN
jgi:glycosyltransferase involved in cell wall biosynthesis